MRIGHGYDVHRLVPDRKLVLCGVEIPCEKGLLGHSDADVAVHALMDALLGAAVLGDIGRLFPDTDPGFSGISSLTLLDSVMELLLSRGFSVGNADITVVAQWPKLSGYIDEMRSVLRPLHALGADITVADCPVFDYGAAIRAFDHATASRPDAVIINHVSNVFGFELPVYEVAELCRDRGIPLIVDASQSAGVLDVDAGRLGADFIAMPGHKGLYGPQGTGLLIASDKARPLLYGGSGSDSKSPDMPPYLPDMLEAGTHNMPGIAGLCAGLAFVEKTGTGKIAAHEKLLAASLIRGLRSIRGVRVFAAPDMEHQTGVVSFELDAMGSEEAAGKLADLGFALRAGLHCAPLAHRTVGTLDRGTVRASVSAFNTEREIAAFLDAVELIARGAR